MAAPAYLPLFGSDYLADTSHLTTEEHGAYLLLLIAAWRQDDCGLPNDDRKLARITGLSARKWLAIKDTILEFWTVEGGRIFQARLRKERGFADQKSENNRRSARTRWDRQDAENKASDECERTSKRNAPQPQPQPQKKEEGLEPDGSCPTRVGRDAESLPLDDDEQEPDDSDKLKPEHVVEVWNQVAPKLGKPKVRDLTPSRRQLLKARIGRHGLEDFRSVFGKIERSAFLRGDTGWAGCTFDWVFKQANFQKILEGNYDQ